MNASTTATVETLTAEVRTLVVGARQVTLSVARQLDWVSAAILEPFGRVRLLGSAGPDHLTAIGRAPGGALALAGIYRQRETCRPMPLNGTRVRRCPAHMPAWIAAREAGGWPAPEAWEAHRWYLCTSADAQVGAEVWDKLAALPLIVLAGLR